MYLSIIIPAYNEQYRIIPTLEKVIYYIEKNNIYAEVIVVDDGSDDRTFTLIETFSKSHDCIRTLHNCQNEGKGASVRQGVLAAKGEYILFTDADNSTPIEELNKLLPLISSREFDIAIGSRGLKESEIEKRQPLYRMIMGKTFNCLVRLFLYKDFWDTQCGFKCFSRKAAQEIFKLQRINRFAFDVEVLAIAKVKGYRIKEVPVVWMNSLPNRVKLVKDSFQMFMDIFRLKYNLHKQAYG